MPLVLQEDILPEQILQAALHLYRKHGLKKVTMDDVSKAIGKSRSSLYYYYKNRDEIFEAVMDTLIRDVINEIEVAVSKAATVADKLRAFCLTKVKTSEDRKAFFSAIEAGMDFDEMSRHAQYMSQVHKRLMAAEATMLKAVLAGGAKSKEIRTLKPKELETLIFVLLGGIRGIRRELQQESSFARLEPAVDTLTGMTMQWLKKED
ncbi:TetR/AcrR family transcriptional regulator [Taibaiella koreensis]|uniref:TetR/AcrR family transcriptional regulator n=1 Tax=Taibaiella koreensis TaxID=1268548 RepID=UPI000E59E279|nr:TetR/AcrR family transcriptional regulator [Taibaiella koreensis]